MMRASVILGLLLASSCAKPDVSVELAAVTLADDCGDAAQPARPTTLAQGEARESAGAAMMCAEGADCGMPARSCDATSMQLSIRGSKTKATTIRVKKVELLDADGRFLEELTARKPSRWADDGKYIAWDETVAANQTVAASYLLRAPNWTKVAKNRWEAHTKKFQLRVTVIVGDSEQTIEKQSITPVMMQPEVVT